MKSRSSPDGLSRHQRYRLKKKTGTPVGLDSKGLAELNRMLTDAMPTVSPVAKYLDEYAIGVKRDDGKVRTDLYSFTALLELAKVLTFGAKKYEAHNWRKGLAWSRVVAALLRHTFAFAEGTDNDPETGLSHMAHAMCCAMFLLEYQKTNTGTDDRYKTVPF